MDGSVISFFGGEKIMVQRIVEVVEDYEDRVNLTALCVSRLLFLRRRLLLPVFPSSIHSYFSLLF